MSEEFTGYTFIWPENYKLTLIEEEGVIINRKYIQIPVKGNIKKVNISIESHNNGINTDICRYYFNIYNTSFIYPLISNINYGFKVPKDEIFKFELNVEGETNPVYYILLNKLGNGDLKINLNNEEITITDFNPYRGIYVNRDNLFKECSN